MEKQKFSLSGGPGYEGDERKSRTADGEPAADGKTAARPFAIRLYKFFLINYTVFKTIPGSELVCRGFVMEQFG